MLLAEAKRLKVAELRAMLTERGLDPRGLKAELVIRLISAIEAGVEPIGGEGEGRNDGEATSRGPDSELGRGTRSPACVGPPKTSTAAYTDQSTQTDPLPLCSCTAPVTDGCGEQRQRHPAASLHPVAMATAAAEDAESCSSPVLSLSEADSARQRLLSGPEESGEPETSCEERGRDYYEFKEDIHYNRAKTPELPPEPEEEAAVDSEDVRLDSYNCDLHFEADPDGGSGRPLFWEKFPFLWSGCRMTHGFSRGKVGFEAEFVKRLPAPASDPDGHGIRLGWSVDDTSLQLGEVERSYGFDGRGKKVTGGREEAFGEPFTEGDVIGCYAFISETGEATLWFHKNGRSLGAAFHLSSSALGGQALFPHVLCKNCSVRVNLDPEAPWRAPPAGFRTLPSLAPGRRTRAPLPAASRSECEVLMMVGLPGSGKTHWARTHMLQNPRKRYSLLSTNSILSCMREPPGAGGRQLMLQQASQCVGQLIRRAAAKKRNYILDQANIYPSARRHKMLCFHGYQRRAVVVLPPDEVWRRRLVQRREQEGTALQDTSLLKAKASFTLPEQGEHLDQVMFVELGSDEALELLTHYKEEARRLLPAPPKRKRHRKGSQNRPVHQCGWREGSFGSHYTSQKAQGRSSGFGGSYGCSSDPQRYRNYYRPYTGQWSLSEQNQSGYGGST
ncbi:heterogeneous nuclear ribonucleoprotein U-like protein 2 isoform X1 [Puntigrus tetrazona]|uniref:heterogeneous nuclear ribonucleoprotein U-like protein 2 isoform X1 n=1 Tax=Puntigrus tetrazona TaxID=1606681 RepID=UPI001C8A1215|nr:heterogeneous nuclear ribonucleoprotein U-like protein 2 isoform X1 [Puntigrus tetrazona]